MLQKFLWIGITCLVFAAGYFLAMPKQQDESGMAEQLAALSTENKQLGQHNAQLEQTIALVKRQIQTDRIAYAALQKTVEDSDRKRQDMLAKFESQRELLDRLKQKIDSLQTQ